MSYAIVTSGRTEYAVDWDIVERFSKSYWSAFYQDQYSALNTLSDSSWYNPLSWSLPKLQTVDFDWAKVKSSTQTAVARDLSEYKRGADSNMRSIAYDLKYKVEQTAAIRRTTKDWLREIQNANIAAMQQAEDDYTGLIEACKFVRDTSTDIVAIGSTIATGGAAAGLLGASSMLKGVYKYQDTGKAGAAVLYGAGSMALGAFKIRGAKLTSGGEYTLVIAQGILEGTTSLASGKSFGDAVADGGLKIAAAGTSQAIFSNGIVKDIFGRMPVPFTVFSVTSRSGVEYMAEDVADKLVEKTSKKLVEKGIKAGVPAAAKRLTATPQTTILGGAGSGFIDDVPIEQMGLLYFAIVNMDNGIGRGW